MSRTMTDATTLPRIGDRAPAMTTGAEIVCVPVTDDGEVDRRWGKAERVALARVEAGAVTEWQVVDVGWDRSHDAGPEGRHHGRIVGFLRDHDVSVVVAGGMGPPMQHTLSRLGVRTVLGAQGDARSAALRGVLVGPSDGVAADGR